MLPLAKQSGESLENISQALTHSDTNITKTYVNTPNVVQMTAGQIALNNLPKNTDGNLMATVMAAQQKNTSQGCL